MDVRTEGLLGGAGVLLSLIRTKHTNISFHNLNPDLRLTWTSAWTGGGTSDWAAFRGGSARQTWTHWQR